MAGHYTGRHGAIGERDDVGIALTAVLVREGVPLLHACMATVHATERLPDFDFDAVAMLEHCRTVAHERMARS